MLLYTVQTVTYLSMYYTPLDHPPEELPTPMNTTAHAAAAPQSLHSINRNQMALLWTLLATTYIIGIIFALLWALTRKRGPKKGMPWVPSFFRTDVCGICFEPVARFAPALVWPLLILGLYIHSVMQKTREATTCCGRRKRNVKNQARLESVPQPNYDECDDTKAELAELAGPAEPPEFKPCRWLSITRSPTASPPPSYQSKTAVSADPSSLVKPRQSSGGVSSQNSSRSNSVGSWSSCSCPNYSLLVPSPLRHCSASTQPISINVKNLSIFVGDKDGPLAIIASTDNPTGSQEPASPREGCKNSESSGLGLGTGMDTDTDIPGNSIPLEQPETV